jgi:tRNA pseudouridine38-40 synthase
MRNIKLTIEYEGTAYLGWQRQPQGMTIQEALEESLRQITGETTQVTGASRTDTGVHARGQVANFRTDSVLPVERFQSALNALLPLDIAIVAAEEVPEDFHSRFSAQSKLYHYTIWNQRVRPVLDRRFCWHVRWPVEMASLREASACLIGEHDFAAFQSANAQSETTVRIIERADWEMNAPRLTFAIEANGFLYNMVRALVGTLLDVGRGKMTPAEFRRVLESGQRAQAGRTAPARGLCLMRIRYDAPAPISSP